MIEIAGCVSRKGGPGMRVDRQDEPNRRFSAVVVVHAKGRDERHAIGSGVLVSLCLVLTSQRVVFGDGPPKRGPPAVVLLGETQSRYGAISRPSWAPRWSAIRTPTDRISASPTTGRYGGWNGESIGSFRASTCCRWATPCPSARTLLSTGGRSP